jgi:SsrA-binding protein
MEILNKKIGSYFIIEDYEAGMVLNGSEVRCIKNNGMDIKNAFVYIDNKNEAWLVNSNIPMSNTIDGFQKYDPIRSRKLLLNKREIFKIKGLISEKGYTVVPKKCYFVKNRLKCLISVVKGKKEYDKRQDIKERESNREIERYVKKEQKVNF